MSRRSPVSADELDFNAYIGSMIALYRKDRGISQTELAKLTNTNSTSLGRLEGGHEDGLRITAYQLASMAKVLRVSVTQLLPPGE